MSKKGINCDNTTESVISLIQKIIKLAGKHFDKN